MSAIIGAPRRDLSISTLEYQQQNSCHGEVKGQNITACLLQTFDLVVSGVLVLPGGAVVDDECATFPQGVCTHSISGLSPIEVMDELKIEAGLTVNSVMTANSTVTVNGTLVISTGASAGDVLTSDASGNATWQPAPSPTPSLQSSTITNLQGSSTIVSNVILQKIGRWAQFQFDWVQTAIGGPYDIVQIDDPDFWPVSTMLILGFRDNTSGSDTQEFRCDFDSTTGRVHLPFFGTTTGGQTVTFVLSYITVA
jgi:hypothetical protein